MKTLTKICLLFFAATNLSGYAATPDNLSQERFQRMQNTIDELASRVSTLKEENKRLEKAVTAALQAERNNATPKIGCDHKEVARSIAFESSSIKKEMIFMKWIRQKGETCTTEQLAALRKVAGKLYYKSAPLAAVTFLEEN